MKSVELLKKVTTIALVSIFSAAVFAAEAEDKDTGDKEGNEGASDFEGAFIQSPEVKLLVDELNSISVSGRCTAKSKERLELILKTYADQVAMSDVAVVLLSETSDAAKACLAQVVQGSK